MRKAKNIHAKDIHCMTSDNRHEFFASMQSCIDLMAEIMDPMGDDPWILKDLMRSEITYARLLRESGVDYPRIP